MVVSASCERTAIPSEPKIIATFEAEAQAPEKAATKVSISEDYILSWEEGDRILVNDGSVDKLFIAQSKGSSTKFSAEGVVLVDHKTYCAAFPESSAVFNDGVLKFNLPETFAATPGAYPAAPAVALGNGAEKKLEFKNVCALISFNVTGSNVTSVTIEGAKGETLAGLITVDPHTAEYSIAEEDRKDKIVLTSTVNALFPGKYYVPVLPGNFENGIIVTLKMSGTENDLVREFEAINLERSKYFDLEKLDDGRFVRYEISSKDDLKQFLEDAAKCKAYVTAKLLNDIDVNDIQLPSAESFAGSFDGEGYAIKNWTSSSPLFKTLNAGASVKDLVLHSTCSLTLAESESPYQSFIVGHNKGTVTGCVNKAAVSYTASSLNKRVFGTIVGFNAGYVEDCHNEGDFNLNLSGAAEDQNIGGVVGGFTGNEGSETVKACTNKGNISVKYDGATSGATINVAGVCAVAYNPETENTANQGKLRGCTNSGTVSLTLTGEQTEGVANIGGVAAEVQATVEECQNTGEVSLIAENTFTHNVGGIAAVAVAGNIHSSSNAGGVTLTGTATGVSSVGGIAAMAGETAATTTYNIKDCVNSGAVTAEISAPSLGMGGIVGWTSIPVVGSEANKLQNNGAILVKEAGLKEAFVGGVIGESISTFDKIYNSEKASVIVNMDSEVSEQARVAGVAGFMNNVAEYTFKQGHNRGRVELNGGRNSNKVYYVAGVVAKSTTKEVKSNSHSWAECHSNYGNITVDAPVIVYVGGVIGEIGATTAGDGHIAQCKFQGTISVNSPATKSCIGGVIAKHWRGQLGNANTFGESDAKTGNIIVSNADAGTYVGGYAGMIETNNGAGTTISGYGMSGSIVSGGATAGIIIGHTKMTGNSCKNIIKLGTSATERPKISKKVTLDSKVVGDFSTEDITEADYFGLVTPSATSTTNPDKYYFQTPNISGNLGSFKEGLLNR